MKKAPPPPLVLHQVDTRTADEIERDLMREAQKKTIPLFENPPSEATPLSPIPTPDTPPQTEPRVVFDSKQDRVAGKDTRQIGENPTPCRYGLDYGFG